MEIIIVIALFMYIASDMYAGHRVRKRIAELETQVEELQQAFEGQLDE